jgi:phosphomannomutase
MATPLNLDNVIKAYDIRGLVDKEITADFTFSVGVAFAAFLEMERESATVVIGQDMRPSSEELATAFADGVTSRGFDVIRIGLSSTDMLYFASGKLNLPGVMFTASHNPAQYNGMKFCKSGAKPIGKESGLTLIRKLIEDGAPMVMRPAGVIKQRDMLHEYADYLVSLFPEKTFDKRKLKVVVDAGNGMAGFTAGAVMEKLSVELIPMYFELDGTFPNHEANPIDPKNLKDLQKRVKKEKADLGLAFDGDADRCFLIDENGDLVNPSALTALIAVAELNRVPKAKIIYNLISSKAVPEVIAENGGTAIRSRVGHSYIKQMMAQTGAVFGGEHSGHFYFERFWRADSGMLAALFAIAQLMQSKLSISKLLQPYNRYFSSGEINSKMKNADAAKVAIDKVKAEYGSGNEIDDLDGLTITSEKWWLNLRPSNTEPLLRLNVEADSSAKMAKIRDEVLELIASIR